MSTPIKLAYCLLGIYKPGGLERITASKINYFASIGYVGILDYFEPSRARLLL